MLFLVTNIHRTVTTLTLHQLPKQSAVFLTEILSTAQHSSAVPGHGEVAGGHRLLDDLLHGGGDLGGPETGAADEDSLHPGESADSDGRCLDALHSDAGHLRVPDEVEGEEVGHVEVSGRLNVLDENIIDLSHVWSNKSDILHTKSFEPFESCSEWRGLEGVLLSHGDLSVEDSSLFPPV